MTHAEPPENSLAERPLYTIPIAERPQGHGSWFSKLFFPLVFNLGILGINSAQFLFLLLRLIPGRRGKQLYNRAIDWTKDGFGRLLIAITVLFAPTSLTISTDRDPAITGLVDTDHDGNVTKINLPDRLVIMANHQAYTDWMYLWILACYCRHAEGITILLKASLKNIPIVGWGMQFFRFIFMRRSWAADKNNLSSALLRLAGRATTPGHRSPLWLLIFPEGTIVSDNERAKSLRYAQREDIDDLVGVLHPRSTGLLFCLRTLLPSIPDLQLLDVTIGYPGVPFGKYPQEWYGLGSVFWRGVPPPTVHLHLRLYSNLTSPACPVPSLSQSSLGSGRLPKAATAEEAKSFELWLRSVWTEKSHILKRLASVQGVDPHVTVPITQLAWADWVAAFGAGGMGTVAAVCSAISHTM